MKCRVREEAIGMSDRRVTRRSRQWQLWTAVVFGDKEHVM